MAKIKMLVPQYLKEFQCIGSECEDTCCQYWNILVDKHTYKQYKKLRKNEFTHLLSKNLVLNKESQDKYDYAKIKLDENGFCPFLDENKLCRVYSNLSYENMPFTCKIYPRNINCIDQQKEMSLSLSCPEAARKALLPKEIMEFEYVEFDYEEYMQFDTRIIDSTLPNLEKKEHRYFWDIRIASIGLLQNRRFSIVERLMLLGMLYKRFERCITENKYDAIPEQINSFLSIVEQVTAEELFSDMEKNREIQFYVSKIIIDKSKVGLSKYSKNTMEIMAQIRESFKASEEENFIDTFSISNYNGYIDKSIIPFLKKHSHIIENYLTNLFFSHCMPFVGKIQGVWDALIYLCMQYLMVKLFLIGTSNHKNLLTEEDLIKAIYLVSRDLEHASNHREVMLKLNEELELNTLGGLYVLIHD